MLNGELEAAPGYPQSTARDWLVWRAAGRCRGSRAWTPGPQWGPGQPGSVLLHFRCTRVFIAISTAVAAPAVGRVDLSLRKGILRAVPALRIKEPRRAGTYRPVVSRTCAPSARPFLPSSLPSFRQTQGCCALCWSSLQLGQEVPPVASMCPAPLEQP